MDTMLVAARTSARSMSSANPESGHDDAYYSQFAPRPWRFTFGPLTSLGSAAVLLIGAGLSLPF